MGSSISKVSCADISNNHKKSYKSLRRHTVKIDKTKIGIPTDFRHTYHVGNGSPLMEEFGDNASVNKSTSSTVSDKDFMATMAQITDALQKLPLHTSSGYYSPKVAPQTKMGNSASDQQIKSRRSLLNSTELENTLEVSSSMMIPSLKNSDDNIQFSEKERHLLQMTKASSVQLMEHTSPPKLFTSKSDECAPTLLKQGLIEMTTSDLTGGYYDFSSCLQSRIDAQIVELARARSKNNKSNRSPRNNLAKDKPTVMI